MSQDKLYEDFWDKYVEWCRANKVPATMDGFWLWVEETDEVSTAMYEHEPSYDNFR